jgi:hypothetical protein
MPLPISAFLPFFFLSFFLRLLGFRLRHPSAVAASTLNICAVQGPDLEFFLHPLCDGSSGREAQ